MLGWKEDLARESAVARRHTQVVLLVVNVLGEEPIVLVGREGRADALRVPVERDVGENIVELEPVRL